ncbi:hypothetical protein SAMN05216215_105369 [Saccharopolyspora shandongensis]|uniref:Uncharacterized protein n=1 Tax=Saccharopolyspora shandongensis TaxID=418495 RepID=A0A1H3RDT3_9PSEU|nr:hypothetical protein [Saccharopolyspora shandongensis]SDZ23904.1 hypothetical protein SAMN05216215_105369 [Saccharopolyspora shandongensis]
MKSEKQLIKLVEEGWLQQGEKLQEFGGGDRERVHLGAAIGGRHEAPYAPQHPIRNDLEVDFADVPYPTIVVQEGRFHGDEWVHDPTIRGWVSADSPGREAVRCADQLVAAGPEGWFIGTDRRIAVVVESAVLRKSDVGEVPEASAAEEPANETKGFGRLLGKARSAINAVSELSGSLLGGEGLVTLWECPRERFSKAAKDVKGRWSTGSGFSINRFDDGSTIEVASKIHLPGFQ